MLCLLSVVGRPVCKGQYIPAKQGKQSDTSKAPAFAPSAPMPMGYKYKYLHRGNWKHMTGVPIRVCIHWDICHGLEDSYLCSKLIIVVLLLPIGLHFKHLYSPQYFNLLFCRGWGNGPHISIIQTGKRKGTERSRYKICFYWVPILRLEYPLPKESTLRNPPPRDKTETCARCVQVIVRCPIQS